MVNFAELINIVMSKTLFKTILIPAIAVSLFSCNPTPKEGVVNVYTHRHYEADQLLFDKFTEKTGIKVNVVSASADELIQKLELEGANSPADVLITVDAGRLHRAETKDLLQPVSSEILDKNIPVKFRNPEGYWFGLTYRARIFAYSKERVKPEELSSYEALTAPEWKGRILTRSSENIYNQSLLASIIAANGSEASEEWAAGLLANMSRSPKGSDRDQIKAIAAGEADLAFVNTYYLGKMMNSDNEAERQAAAVVKLLFPNQERGTHINISGAGVTKHAPNKENAIKLLEYLTSPTIQTRFAEANYEYPANPKVAASRDLESFGDLIPDTLPIGKLGEYNRQAVEVFNRAGWN
jgi:iron(III) transport system substrate-binding protein